MWSDSLFGHSRLLLSVVVPTRNESATIGPFLTRVLTALQSLAAEIIVVDDSDDNTHEVLRGISARAHNRIVVRHRVPGSVANRTLGTAVVEGIGLARGEYVCVMDADGQHPPEVIPDMLAMARESGADYVGGSRYLPGGSAEGLDGAKRQAISRGLALLTRGAFFRTPVCGLSDPLSGFFLFRRQIVSGVSLEPIGWKISLEILIRAEVQRVAELPYVFARRADDTSKASMSQGLLFLRHLLVLLWSFASVRRVVSFGLVGLSGVVVNTGLLLVFAALGFDALTWPIWLATECAISWNYFWNSRVTWGDRPHRRWWLYQATAWCSSVVAIRLTTLLVSLTFTPLWLGSTIGIAAGMIANYVIFETLVFSNLPPVFGRRSVNAESVVSRR
jgi:dolichol-phosphate mannosyltransferase